MNDASKAPLIDHYRMWSYVTEELSALVSGKFPADVVRQSIVRKSVGSWRGRDCRIRKSVPLKPCPAVPRMMPYKANGSRRHKIPKVRYRVENWASYDAALRRRRDLKIWVSSETITVWTPPAKWRRGRPSRYSDIAIEAGLMLPLASGRPWRQTDHAAPFWPASKRRSPRVSPTPSDRHAGRAPHRKMPSSPPGSAPSGSCGGGSRWPCKASGSRLQRNASIPARTLSQPPRIYPPTSLSRAGWDVWNRMERFSRPVPPLPWPARVKVCLIYIEAFPACRMYAAHSCGWKSRQTG